MAGAVGWNIPAGDRPGGSYRKMSSGLGRPMRGGDRPGGLSYICNMTGGLGHDKPCILGRPMRGGDRPGGLSYTDQDGSMRRRQAGGPIPHCPQMTAWAAVETGRGACPTPPRDDPCAAETGQEACLTCGTCPAETCASMRDDFFRYHIHDRRNARDWQSDTLRSKAMSKATSSSIESTKCSFIVVLMASGMSTRSRSFSRGMIASMMP